MISTTTVAHVESNLAPIKSRVMGVSTTALAAVTDSMANLYTDKYLAVLREYSTNARDSIIAAGKDEPVLVTLPGEFAPTLTIEDHGLGMTEDQVLNFYSQYGDSDKRDSNTQVGSFGFGCKAAFSLADQFTVTAVKDGIQTVALFSRNHEGIGVASVLSTTHTDKPNGVKINIPTSEHRRLKETADFLFAFWPEGSVLVDEEPPLSVTSVLTELAPGISYLPQSHHIARKQEDLEQWANFIYKRLNNTTIVMGGVPYPIAHLSKMYTGKLILWGDIGDVDLVPSREGLRSTPKTDNFLEKAILRIDEAKAQYLKHRISEASTLFEAVCIRSDLDGMFSPGDLREVKFRDMELNPRLYSIDGIAVAKMENTYSRSAGAYVDILSRKANSLSCDKMEGSLAVIGIMGNTKGRLPSGTKAVLEDVGLKRVIFVPTDTFTHEWFSVAPESITPGVTVMSAKDFIKTRKRVARERAAARRAENAKHEIEPTRKAGYDVVQGWHNTVRTPVQTILNCRDVAYTRPSEHGESYRALAALPGLCIVALRRGQSEAALLERVPQAVHFEQRIIEEAKKVLKALTMRQRRLQSVLLKSGYKERRIARDLDGKVAQIKNKEVRDVLRAIQGDDEPMPIVTYLNSLPIVKQLPEWKQFTELGKNPLAAYPLINNASAYDIAGIAGTDHIIAYMNAIDELEKEKEAKRQARTIKRATAKSGTQKPGFTTLAA